LIIDNTWCCFSLCKTVENLFIEIGQVATFSGDTLQSSLIDVGGCKPYNGYCTDNESTVIWSPKNMKYVCPYEYKGNFTGKHWRLSVIIDDLQAALKVQKNGVFCPETDLLKMTEQGIALKIDNSGFDFSIKTPNKNISDFDPINSKLSYLEYKIREFENKNFKSLWYELCNNAQRFLDTVWQFLQYDPTFGARLFLRTNDIIADFAGDALIVHKCHNVTASKIFKDFQIDGKCYKFLPVLVDNKVYFVPPGTKDLVLSSPIVDCNQRHIPIFKHNSKWFTSTGEVHVSKLPFEITRTSNPEMFYFNAPALFHDKLALAPLDFV